MKRTTILLFILALTLTNCGRLYWQRNKVRSTGKNLNRSMGVQIDNRVPHIFTNDFEEQLKEECTKEFIRMGYKINYTDSPDYWCFVKINLDSFKVSGVYAFSSARLITWRTIEKAKVYSIMFDYQIKHAKTHRNKWVGQNDIYYFDNIYRNTKRSINMIKYSIRYGK